MKQLSNREKQVGALIKQGFERPEICRQLNISNENLRDVIRRLRNKGFDFHVTEPEKCNIESELSNSKPREMLIPSNINDLKSHIEELLKEGQRIGRELLYAEARLGALLKKEIANNENSFSTFGFWKVWPTEIPPIYFKLPEGFSKERFLYAHLLDHVLTNWPTYFELLILRSQEEFDGNIPNKKEMIEKIRSLLNSKGSIQKRITNEKKILELLKQRESYHNISVRLGVREKLIRRVEKDQKILEKDKSTFLSNV